DTTAQSRFLHRLVGKRIKPVEVSLVTRQLATLLGAGFPLVQALDALIPQTPSAGLQKKLTQIKDAVVGGSSFADALGQAGDTFPPIYVNMVRSGEASGTLEIVLERLADVTEKQQAVRARIRNAMTYPILMLVIGAAVLIFLLTYIVPTISGIFTEVKQVLPLPTRLLLGFSHWMRVYWWILPIGLAALFQILRTIRRSAAGRLTTDRMILNTPLIGSLVQRLNVARVMRTFGSLLENGVPMLAALEIVRNIAGNTIVTEALTLATQDVGQGKSLSKALGSTPRAFPPLAIQMVDVGEQSGKLEPMLGKIADMYDREVESAISALTALLEPIMILFMGTAVAFVVLAVCLPIFEMNQLIR
ncbi:MAG: type II secretion system F family protein, partial [Desulfobacterales bacterium]|nr:type II secretion system F family protein [Desulfobacterales bacterium]